MRRSVVLTGVIALLAGVLIFSLPWLTQQRERTEATPAVGPPAGGPLVPVDLKPGDEICVRDVPLDPDTRVARFRVPAGPGPDLRVSARGPGYQTGTDVPAGKRSDTLDVRIDPPGSSLRGEFCVRNDGSLKSAVLASQVGQKFARPRPYVNDFPLEQDMPLTFLRGGTQSVGARPGRIIDHAALFTVPPAWLLWLLLAVVALAVPACVLWAMAAAAAAPPEPVPAATNRARQLRLPVFATRIRSKSWQLARSAANRPALLLALFGVAAFAFLYLWASRVGAFQNDEEQTVYFARWITHHLPEGLWDFSLLQRGLQRLEMYVIAFGLGVFGSPGGFRFAHAVNAATFASACVPAYLLARAIGARVGYALIAGVLVVAVPWTVYATTLLTEPLGYPLAIWTVWAIARAVMDPRPRTELVALAVLFVALLTRTGFLALIPVLPLAVVLHELRFGERPLGRLVRGFPARHVVLMGVAAVAVFGVLLSFAGVLPSPSELAGSYGTSLVLDWAGWVKRMGYWASRVVAGTGFVPFAVGLPWIVAELIRPRSPQRHAYALVAALFTVLLLYGSGPAGFEERYAIYFAPPLIIAAVYALDRRDLSPGWVVAGGLFGALLLRGHDWVAENGPYGFFVGPAESFYARVGLLRLDRYVPNGWMSLRTAAFLVALGVTALIAYAFTRRPRAATTAGVLLAALVVLQLAQGSYAIGKFVDLAGARFGPTNAQRAWVDKAMDGKGQTAIVATGIGNNVHFDPVWRDLQFWNNSIRGQYTPGPTSVALPPGDYGGDFIADIKNGDVRGKPPLPRYVIVPRDFQQYGLAGRPVARPSYAAADLWLRDDPAHLRFVVNDTEPDGVLTEGATGKVRFYARGLAGGQCGHIPLVAAQRATGTDRPIPYRVGDKRGVIPAAGQITVELPLEFNGKPYIEVPVSARGKVTTADGRVFAARILSIDVGPCKGG